MSKNKVIIAAAGSGKTSHIVKEALKIANKKVLITTFTEANETEIRNKIISKNKFIPSNITVQTWYSFLLQHGVKPYQGSCYKHDIKGMILVSGQSAKYIKENEVEKHYFDNSQHKIYSDKISKFLIKCNKASGGKVIDRLSRIYSYIFIDEAQDLAGYDFDFIKLLFNSNINIQLVCDPRQGTYSTNNLTKNRKYKKSNIIDFFQDFSMNIDKDDYSFTINYRCSPIICDLSNKLFPLYLETKSGNLNKTCHDGIFLVRPEDIDKYLSQYNPMQLRESKKTIIENSQAVMNFGMSKGLSFERILIYPTKPMQKWLQNNDYDLAPVSRSKLYVAITRAKYSIAFVYDYENNKIINGTEKYITI